jgi:hypothetical protein
MQILSKNLATVFLAGIVAFNTASFSAEALTDQQIRQAIIQESLSTYPGNCPCPYNVDRAGRSCGRRSAYSKPGGYEPLCYPDDITNEMVKDYRRNHSSSERQ